MAKAQSDSSTNEGVTVPPLKDPIARNDAALADVTDLRAELEREIALREGLETELGRETVLRKGFEGELEQERDLRLHTEAELQRVTQMVDTLNTNRLRARRRRRFLRGS